MFVGHYAPALALKPIARAVPLWALFVAVQLLDFGWDLFVLAGIEHVRLVPGFTASNDLDLYDMPWTHSLAAALVWSAVAAALAYRLAPDSDRRTAAWALGACTFSHWVLDLLVHAGDLTIAGDATPHLGLGLWNHPWIEIGVEIGTVLAAGAFAARRAPKPRPVIAITLVLAIVAGVERVIPPPPTVTQLVVSAFVAYVAFALAAGWVDRIEKRS